MRLGFDEIEVKRGDNCLCESKRDEERDRNKRERERSESEKLGIVV